MSEKEVRLFKTIGGEYVISECEFKPQENGYLLDYPANIVPVPQGGQTQIGFGKYIPFADYSKEVLLLDNNIGAIGTPDGNIVDTYHQWKTQMLAKASGIVMAGEADMPRPASERIDFSKLNVGG